MKNKITFLILFIVLGSCSLQAQVTQEWVQIYNGSGNSLAVDGSGNIYVTGFSYAIGTGHDYATIKYNSSGDSLWVARYNGSENGNDRASSLAVDGSGNVYVTGINLFDGGDYATIKYNSSGVRQWVQKYEGPVIGNWHFPSLVVDSSGNVYVTGQSNRGGTGLDYTTIKYNSSGDSLWVARYNGPGNGNDYALSIAVDCLGNVYVTGESRVSVTGNNYATIKYNSSGDSLWVARYSGPYGSANASSIAVDGSGNVYVTGYCGGSGSSDYATIKYNSAGARQWVQIYDEPGYNDFAFSLAVDASGNVYVTGYSGSGFANGYDYATIKYNSSGVQQWVQRYTGPHDLGATDGEVEISIAVDGSENVYVTGCGGGSGSSEYATIKYNSAGVQQWVQQYSGTGNGINGAHSLGVDYSGNVYVTGWGNSGCATIKYSQTEGITTPSKLEAQSIDSSFIKLNWQDNSNDEDGFYIERTKINDSSHWEVINAVPQNVKQYSDYLVTRGLKYYYRVKAYSGNIFSEYSNIDSAMLGGNPSFIPPAPSKLSLLKRTANAITMDWHDNSGNENGFIIFRKSEGDLFFEITDSVGTDVVTYQEVGVSPDLDLYYKICSYNASGISDYSNTLIVPGKSAPDINESKQTRNNILSGNYPNPFNPVTVIRYSLIENRFITLKVYDILGNEVATLVNEKQNAGSYEVDFDGSNFSSGVYFYKLVVDGNIIDTKRMVLLK